AFSLGKGFGIALDAILVLAAALYAQRTLAARIAAEGPLRIQGDGRDAELLEQIDEWSYRAIAIGLPMVAFVLMSGAVWAQMAWSTFWSWDPKEVWALITFT